MIICYHKTRKRFYVIKDNTKDGRKFLFSSSSFEECEQFAGAGCKLAKSALGAMGWAAYEPHPTPSDASSDAASSAPATNIARPGDSHPTPPHKREEDE